MTIGRCGGAAAEHGRSETMYSALHQIDSNMEVGADFSAEYAAAMDMLKK